MIWTSVALVTCLLAASCAAAPSLPNPANLPPRALALQQVVERGCLPYLLGEKSEAAAMRSAGLHHVVPPPIPVLSEVLELPKPLPRWEANVPFGPGALASRNYCSTNNPAGAFDANREAVEEALLHKLGPATEDDSRSAYKAVLPGQITGCRGGIHYTFYPRPRGGRFELDLYRVPECSQDRTRIKAPANP